MNAICKVEARDIRNLLLFATVVLRHGSRYALNRSYRLCGALILLDDVKHDLLGVVPVAFLHYLSN